MSSRFWNLPVLTPGLDHCSVHPPSSRPSLHRPWRSECAGLADWLCPDATFCVGVLQPQALSTCVLTMWKLHIHHVSITSSCIICSHKVEKRSFRMCIQPPLASCSSQMGGELGRWRWTALKTKAHWRSDMLLIKIPAALSLSWQRKKTFDKGRVLCRCFRKPFTLPSTEVALTHWDTKNLLDTLELVWSAGLALPPVPSWDARVCFAC